MKKILLVLTINLAITFTTFGQTLDRETLTSGNGSETSELGESVQYTIGQAYQTTTIIDGSFALTPGFQQPAFSSFLELINPNLEGSKIGIYPNPAINYVNLELNLLDDKGVKCSIINIWGQVIGTQNYNVPEGEQKLVFSFGYHLPPGIYTIKVIANGNTYVKKLLIK